MAPRGDVGGSGENVERCRRELARMIDQHRSSLTDQVEAYMAPYQRSEAEDTVQKAFLTAFRLLLEQRGPEPSVPERAWLGEIVRRQYLNDCRKRIRNEAVAPSRGLDDMSLGAAGVIDEALDRFAEDLDRQEMFVRAAKAADLAPKDRLLLDLVVVRGLTIKEAAVRVGISYQAGRQRKSRALRKLRQALRREDGAT